MDEIGFRGFLRRNGRSEIGAKKYIALVKTFEQYLGAIHNGKSLKDVKLKDIQSFVKWNRKRQESSTSSLWALHRYFEFTGNNKLRQDTIQLRLDELKKERDINQPLKLSSIRGVVSGHARKLADLGIRNTEQLLEEGGTKQGREHLSAETGISLRAISELVRIADIARLPNIEGILGRLLYEAGIDSIDKLTRYKPEELRNILLKTNKIKRISQSSPSLRDTMNWINQAKNLPKLLEE
ncbi:MAG: DUF4332 domain-containing protein [Candidatus Ranarchaeia archaeon]|jgi:hypothetical protein